MTQSCPLSIIIILLILLFSGFPGWLVLTSHPGLDSSGPTVLGRRSWRPGLSGRWAGGLWSQQASRNRGWDHPAAPSPPTCLPANRRGELLKMPFPFIFPVKSLPVTCTAAFLSLAGQGPWQDPRPPDSQPPPRPAEAAASCRDRSLGALRSWWVGGLGSEHPRAAASQQRRRSQGGRSSVGRAEQSWAGPGRAPAEGLSLRRAASGAPAARTRTSPEP